MPISIPKLSLALAAGAVLLTGCGGSGGSSSNSANLRAVDASVNGSSDQVLANGGAIYGHLNYFNAGNGQAATPYLYLNNGTTTFGYTTGASVGAGAVTTNTVSANLDSGQYYTAVLIGRADTPAVTSGASTVNDPRFLQTILLPARSGASGGSAQVRVVDAAPDAGWTNPAVAGTAGTLGSVTITLTPAAGSPVTFSNVNYAGVSGYQAVQPGVTYTVTVTPSAGAAVTPATTTETFTAGAASTLYLTETAVTPSYDLKVVGD